MIDKEKVIKGIQECDLNGGLIGDCPYKGILSLLREQKPVKPKNDAFGHPYCPKCNVLVYQTWNYCPHCGQAVKWE